MNQFMEKTMTSEINTEIKKEIGVKDPKKIASGKKTELKLEKIRIDY